MIPIGYIGQTTARLDLQEVPEDGAISEPSPEAVPAEVAEVIARGMTDQDASQRHLQRAR